MARATPETSGGHDHVAPPLAAGDRRLVYAVVLSVALVAFKLGAAAWSGSLALAGDAVHTLTDVLAYGGAYLAARAAARAPTPAFTYGFGRGRVLAALGNAVLLVILAALLAAGAVAAAVGGVDRPAPAGMFAAGAVGVGASVAIGLLLGRADDRRDVNRRAAFLHAAADAAASAGVLVAAALVAVTGVRALDAAAAVAIAAAIVAGSWGVVRDTAATLMEAAPPGLSLAEVREALVAVEGVRGAHHLHVWQVDDGAAMSGHLVVADGPASECERVVARCAEVVARRFAIGHSTFQVETAASAGRDATNGG